VANLQIAPIEAAGELWQATLLDSDVSIPRKSDAGGRLTDPFSRKIVRVSHCTSRAVTILGAIVLASRREPPGLYRPCAK
jgi:hypothetical protein